MLHVPTSLILKVRHPAVTGFTVQYKYRLYDETEGSTGFRAIDTRARSARVSIGFQGDLNPIGPKGFIV